MTNKYDNHSDLLELCDFTRANSEKSVMNAVTRWFVRAKNYEVFLLFFIPLAVGEVASVNLSMRNGHVEFNLGTALVASLGLAVAYTVLLWLWSVGKLANSATKPKLRLSFPAFRFAILYPAIYLALAIPLFETLEGAAMFIILPFHLTAIGCLLYDLHFVAKGLVLCGRRRPVTFYDYAGPFFLIWFWPVGIWSVQPRVNRIYANTIRETSEEAIEAFS